LDGVKCAIAEKNASKERVNFLRELLEHNGFTVKVVPSPPPKTAAAPQVTEGGPTAAIETIPAPETFTIGVTHVSFNPTNAGQRTAASKNSVYTTGQPYHIEWHATYACFNTSIAYLPGIISPPTFRPTAVG